MTDDIELTGDALAQRLAEKEAQIKNGLDSAASALLSIRKERLYKASHSAWNDYCREVLGMSGSRADQIIRGGELAKIFANLGLPAPANDEQARAFAPLEDDPEAIAEVVKQVTEADEPVTAKAIAEAVANRLQQVEDVVTELEAARDEVGRLNAMAPDDFDPALNSRLIAERGQLMRVCNELIGMGDPAELLERQSKHLRESHIKAVSEASAWLSFLNKVMEDR